ncbi:MAG: peptide chain release factor 2 [Eubacteriales bacterium]|nr:peptide chain release factor 2 [Eubacteriales bacterium]MDD4324211.1 peptide chain release factor 2 [Eubacteriales bacterium]MDD4541430.1 peptide chain release factor 2 [Eubacteriales bacterium]
MIYSELNSIIENHIEKLALLEQSLCLDADREEVERLSALTMEPDFWEDPKKASKIQERISHLERKEKRFLALKSELEDIEVLCELGSEAEDLDVAAEVERALQNYNKDYEQLRLETMLSGEHDSANALVTLHAGAGGTEAQDWTEMLERMYVRWAEDHGYTIELLDLLQGDEAGIKSVSFRVKGVNAYGYLLSEHGVHRLVRISPFDSSGRRHTSFASCEVLPELDDTITIDIQPDDLRIDTYRASGAGGQHVNKTSSAVRITHLPTGIVVSCQNERSQIQNRETAMSMLKSKLYQLAQQQQLERIEDLKGDVGSIAWGNQIRSYIFCPYTMVKDHRTDVETGNVDAVMDGDIDRFINAYLVLRAQKGD